MKLALLADEDFIMFYRHVSHESFDGLTAACRTAGFSLRILHEVRSVASQVAFVGCGQGIALVPPPVTASWLPRTSWCGRCRRTSRT